uniref:Uncharacterized protein n=1 Tax=Ixodes ricinus TaxID=34613 RepID=A0A6B0UD39_IXORI
MLHHCYRVRNGSERCCALLAHVAGGSSSHKARVLRRDTAQKKEFSRKKLVFKKVLFTSTNTWRVFSESFICLPCMVIFFINYFRSTDVKEKVEV